MDKNNTLNPDNKNNKNLIRHSRELPRIKCDIGNNAQKMLLCFFGQIKNTDDSFAPMELSADYVTKYCGFNVENQYELIANTVKEIAKSELKILTSPGQYTTVAWTRYISYEQGVVRYQLNSALQSELLRLYENKRIYSTVNPGLLPAFTGPYGLRLYMILSGDIASHKLNPEYSLESICEMFELPDAYNPKISANAAANQKAKIVGPAIQEINSVSDLTVDLKVNKFSRKITGWTFAIKNRKKIQQETPSITQEAEPMQSPWYKDESIKNNILELIRYGLSKDSIPVLIQAFNNKENFIFATRCAIEEIVKAQEIGMSFADNTVLETIVKQYAPSNISAKILAIEPNDPIGKRLNLIKHCETWKDIIEIATQKKEDECFWLFERGAFYRNDLLSQYAKQYLEKYKTPYKWQETLDIAKMFGIEVISYKEV